jgi:hypothetical protein
VKSIAGQSVAQLGGRSSVLSRQKRDHIKLDGFLNRLCSASGDERDRLLLKTYRLVFFPACWRRSPPRSFAVWALRGRS